MSDKNQKTAAQVMDTIHLIMRTIGGEMKNSGPSELSMQQFRSVLAVHINNGASLSDIAEHTGSTMSAASKMVDGLVERGLIERTTDPKDRRKLVLTLTEQGRSAIDRIDLFAINCLGSRLSSLSANECAVVSLAMDILRSAVQTTSEDHRR